MSTALKPSTDNRCFLLSCHDCSKFVSTLEFTLNRRFRFISIVISFEEIPNRYVP